MYCAAVNIFLTWLVSLRWKWRIGLYKMSLVAFSCIFYFEHEWISWFSWGFSMIRCLIRQNTSKTLTTGGQRMYQYIHVILESARWSQRHALSTSGHVVTVDSPKTSLLLPYYAILDPFRWSILVNPKHCLNIPNVLSSNITSMWWRNSIFVSFLGNVESVTT